MAGKKSRKSRVFLASSSSDTDSESVSDINEQTNCNDWNQNDFFKLNLIISSFDIYKTAQKLFNNIENNDIYDVSSAMFVSFAFFIMFKLIDFILCIYLNNN
jgi:hypothetical protein